MITRPVASAVAAAGFGRREVVTAGVGAALAFARLTEHAEAAATAKSGWRYWPKCRGLLRGNGTKSMRVCPAGGALKPLAGFNYLLLSGLSVTDSNLSSHWFQCQKCRGLFTDPLGNTGVCPKGGGHANTGPEYVLWDGTSPPFMEAGWHQCANCFGLY